MSETQDRSLSDNMPDNGTFSANSAPESEPHLEGEERIRLYLPSWLEPTGSVSVMFLSHVFHILETKRTGNYD